MVGENRGYHPRFPCECRGPHSRHPLSINSKAEDPPTEEYRRDIVTDFSEDGDIELCNDDAEGTEPGHDHIVMKLPAYSAHEEAESAT
ncbi:unnamed protein product [Lupinus luteus]|uniref:Uncharacterized protein n=1 Tax=Lupinus luteus TaxID=3873 RepID=A0AAV1WWJ2_LUPLU